MTKRFCRSVALLALSLAGLFASTSSQAQYRFDVWTADDGLPQNVIRGLRQTPDGFLWIATLDGVARFDGVHFTVYNRSNTPGIESNRFSSLYASHAGDLWLDIEHGGVTHYRDGVFQTLGADQGVVGTVDGLTGDDAGKVWILSGGRIEEWRGAEHRFVDITPAGDTVYYTPLLWQTGFWGADSKGLHCFFRGQFLHYSLPAWLKPEDVWVTARDGHGTMWMETRNGRRARIAPGQTGVEDLGRGTVPTTSFQDRSGHEWAMRIGNRLERSIEFLSSGQMTAITFTRLFEDREDNLWLGTEGHGLYRLQRQSIASLSTPQGLPVPRIYPLLADHHGNVWLGTWGGGVARYAAGHITLYGTAEGWGNDPITALAEDHEGSIWVARNALLNVIQDGQIRKPPVPVLPEGAVVQAIYDDGHGGMWFGTSLGLAAYRQNATQFYTKKNGLATTDVRVIIGDGQGGLWIGGYGGLTRLHDGKLSRWTEQDGLPSNNVRAIYRDSEGVLWVGTYDGGLARFKDGKFTRYTTETGLFNDGVFQILEDSRGNFWMSCNRGIYRVSKRELNEFADGTRKAITAVAYGKADGMLNVECNGGFWPAGTSTPDGKLWFPTQDGVAVVDPASISSNPQPPPVVIQSAAVDLAPVPVDTPLRIAPGKENLEIQYTALSFINSTQIHFKYMLENLDTGWIDAGSRRTAYYSHVPPGRYVFHVIAGNRDGVWNTQGQTLAITVLAPFYRTWWFFSLLLLAAAAAVWMAWHLRTLQFERAQAQQRAFSQQLIASQESERKRIAAELHDSLGQRLVVINNLALFSLRAQAKLAPNSFDPQALQEISAEVVSAIDETRGISYNLRPFQLDRLGLTKAVEGIIRSVSKASDMRIVSELDNIDDLFAEDLRINVYRIVQESLNNVMKYAEATDVAVRIQRDADHVTLTVEDNGKGFSLKAPVLEDRRNGFGMTGMAERARLLGGDFRVRSAPGQGTILTVRIPLAGNGHDQ